MEESVQFVVPDDFNEKACRHCVALFLLSDTYPAKEMESATLTLIEFESSFYGVTCKHVIERAKEIGADIATVRREIMRFPAESFYSPPSAALWTPGAPEVDIALVKLKPTLPASLGKKPLNLRELFPLEKATHGIAVGYPEKIKFRISDNSGYWVASRCVHVVAENHATKEADTFVLFSNLQVSPELDQFSGLSGGPIFWTTEVTYGLLGIVRSGPGTRPEAANPGEADFGSGPRVSIRGERVTPERLAEWVGGMSAA